MSELTCSNTYCAGRTQLSKREQKGQALRNGKELCFAHPLDDYIRDIVITLIKNGVETFQSCQGGPGHSFPRPTVQFEGSTAAAFRALSVALDNGLPVDKLQRVWDWCRSDGSLEGPWWEMTFIPHPDSPLGKAFDADLELHETTYRAHIEKHGRNEIVSLDS